MPLILALAAISAALAAALLGALVLGAGIMDAPDRERKIHKDSTPTSGGVAIGAGFALGLAIACLAPFPTLTAALTSSDITAIGAASLFSFGALALGLADDVRPLSAMLKSGLMLAFCLGVALFVAHAEDLPIVGAMTVHLGFVLGVIGSAAWVFVLMNASNFMDGADGLAIGSNAISLAALALVCVLCGAPGAALTAAAGAGALIGFLGWNWPCARLFAGDSGALFAGMLGAAVSLFAIREGGISPFVMPILFFPTLADALLTLAWRFAKRRNLLNGHREHFYQIGLRADFKPLHVTLWYWLATLGCAAAGIGAAAFQRFAAAPPAEGDASSAAAQTLYVVAAIAPKLVLLAIAVFAIWLSAQVRKFSVARGLDGE